MGNFIRKHGVNINVVLSRIIAGCFVVAILSFAAASAFGQSHPERVGVNFWCFDGEALDDALRGGDNQEVPLVSGIGSGGVAMLIYVNPETKAWSFVIVQPNGRACMVGAGEDFETAGTDLFPPKPKKGGGI